MWRCFDLKVDLGILRYKQNLLIILLKLFQFLPDNTAGISIENRYEYQKTPMNYIRPMLPVIPTENHTALISNYIIFLNGCYCI